ncbi:TIGR03936 family radical SAM-associated protein [Thermobrachium celere]|uniref:TIGR03936 family radical SAM-associated protein n=1 Tax=Thermobrachium celere TaxID=53422 RepID=UPI0019458B09|nr:TIGR03936 family radical SAM-associated protein [Thermobrachium celere]GFR36291.1 radical SAM protein [Thermobrachium celere]
MNRYVLKLKKIGDIKYISHLDTMRTLHRAIRRAELPITYSKGFNPHPSISFASPLSVGVESLAEYVDIEFDKIIDTNEIKNKINDNMPSGLEIIEAIHIKEKMPTSMAAVKVAKYEIKMKYDDIKNIEAKIKDIINSKEIIRTKKSKSGEKLVNIREMIYDLKLKEVADEYFIVECTLKTSNSGSLSPEILADLLKEVGAFGQPVVRRIEMYAEKDSEFIPLDKYYKRV